MNTKKNNRFFCFLFVKKESIFDEFVFKIQIVKKSKNY